MSVISFYFKEGELFIMANGDTSRFEDFSNNLWNDCAREQLQSGLKKETLTLTAQQYGKVISDVKKYARPFGELGITIIREITRIATKLLEFVIEQAQKVKTSGVIEVDRL